mgnify:CR=1 FL=1
MITDELERRLALYYATSDTKEDWETKIGDPIIDLIWKNNDTLTEDELFTYGKQVIDNYLSHHRK